MLTSLVSSVTDLVLPRSCVGCGRPGVSWCAACLPVTDPFGIWCRALWVVAAAPYAGAVRAALLRYKERDRRDLAGILAPLLASSVAALVADEGSAAWASGHASTGSPVLVPVPSSRAALAKRGCDPLAALTSRVGTRLGLTVEAALTHTRAVHDSAGLDAAARAANLAGAIVAAPAYGPRTAVLVDDIVTTAATLREAQRALRAAGWSVLGGAVVAATEKPRRNVIAVPLAVPSGAV